MTFGFEKEFFVETIATPDKPSEPVWNPSPLPTDSCGYLVEIRTTPHTDPLDAIHLLMAKEYVMRQHATEKGWSLVNENSRTGSRQVNNLSGKSSTTEHGVAWGPVFDVPPASDDKGAAGREREASHSGTVAALERQTRLRLTN